MLSILDVDDRRSVMLQVVHISPLNFRALNGRFIEVLMLKDRDLVNGVNWNDIFLLVVNIDVSETAAKLVLWHICPLVQSLLVTLAVRVVVVLSHEHL